MFSENVQNFIDSIHYSHLENAQNAYTASNIRGRVSHSVSPLTNFVFEFFLFNSLYAINWSDSLASRTLVEHPRNKKLNESKQQREFVKFCRYQQKKIGDLDNLTEAFLPLARLEDLTEAWTSITPDARISDEHGRRFFEKIAELGRLAEQGNLKASKQTFSLIDDCCYFVYLVRNNIFHGSKSIAQISNRTQAKRLAIYDLFIRCLNSLFFLSVGKDQCGSGHAQTPIRLKTSGFEHNITIECVYQLLKMGDLKPEDSRLHWTMIRGGLLDSDVGFGDRRALFYPSAGEDILFPLIAGLPTCTDFYFYDSASRNYSAPHNTRLVRRTLSQLNLESEAVTTTSDDLSCYAFHVGNIARRIWLVKQDNLNFLDLDVPVAFYFHRGDSCEGGSGQLWDSELLPRIIERASADSGLRILTDGWPGGLDATIEESLKKLLPPNSHRRRDYFFGIVKKSR